MFCYLFKFALMSFRGVLNFLIQVFHLIKFIHKYLIFQLAVVNGLFSNIMFCLLQANLRNIAGLVPDHGNNEYCNKASDTNFLVSKCMFIKQSLGPLSIIRANAFPGHLQLCWRETQEPMICGCRPGSYFMNVSSGFRKQGRQGYPEPCKAGS